MMPSASAGSGTGSRRRRRGDGDVTVAGTTGTVKLEGLEFDGTSLWRLDLGRNIREGAHYTQFIVYDLDGDGRILQMRVKDPAGPWKVSPEDDRVMVRREPEKARHGCVTTVYTR